MAVFTNSTSEFPTGTSFDTNDPTSWSTGLVASGFIFVAVVMNNDNPASIVGVTFGGLPMTFWDSASDTAGENAHVSIYYIDDFTGVSGSTVSIDKSVGGIGAWAVAVRCESDLSAPMEIYDASVVKLENDGTVSEQSVTDGSPGTNSQRYAAGFTGLASPPAVGANTTSLGSIDVGQSGGVIARRTNASQGSGLVGFSSGTSDDRAYIHFAVREIPGGGTTLTPAFQTHTRQQFTVKTNPKLPVAFQTHTRQQFTVTVSVAQTTTPALQTHTRQQFDLKVAPKLPVAFQTHTRQQFDLKTNPTLPVELQTHTRQQFTVNVGAFTILPVAFQTHTRQQFALLAHPTLPVELQTHTRQQFEITVDGPEFVAAGRIDHTRQQFNVLVHPELVPVRQDHTRQQFNVFIPADAPPDTFRFYPTLPTLPERPDLS